MALWDYAKEKIKEKRDKDYLERAKLEGFRDQAGISASSRLSFCNILLINIISFNMREEAYVFDRFFTAMDMQINVNQANMAWCPWRNAWRDTFFDIVAAQVDRLCYKAFLINMSGPLFRIKETKKMVQNSLVNNSRKIPHNYS